MFTLWDQRGSQVQRGRIIVLPIGRSILYVQPVYLISTGNTKIPELTRIILSMGNVVVMDTNLESAWAKLEERLRTGRRNNNTLPPLLNIPPAAQPSGAKEPTPAAGPM